MGLNLLGSPPHHCLRMPTHLPLHKWLRALQACPPAWAPLAAPSPDYASQIQIQLSCLSQSPRVAPRPGHLPQLSSPPAHHFPTWGRDRDHPASAKKPCRPSVARHTPRPGPMVTDCHPLTCQSPLSQQVLDAVYGIL